MTDLYERLLLALALGVVFGFCVADIAAIVRRRRSKSEPAPCLNCGAPGKEWRWEPDKKWWRCNLCRARRAAPGPGATGES